MSNRGPGFILIFILAVATALLAIAWVFPEDGLSIDYSYQIKYPTMERLLGSEEPEYKNISETIMLADSIADAMHEEEIELEVDTIDSILEPPKPKWVNLDSMRAAEKYLRLIEFKNNDPSSLYAFFKSLDEVAFKKGKTHVFHYGDSQIEGDRMTGYIRDRLQKRFGGYAIGLLPASNMNQVKLVNHENSESWSRFPAFFKEGAEGGNDNYGAMTSYSTYTPYPTDSSLSDIEITKAWVRYSTAQTIYNSSKKFKHIKIFHGPVYDAVKMTFPIMDTVFTDYLKGKKSLNVVRLDFDQLRSEVELKFESKISPQIYGISLEAPSGVQVSNIAMRGSSGTIFHKIDRDLFSEMHEELNTSLIILQYGGNVMPYMKDSAQAEGYGRQFYNQIRLVQKAVPNASIVLIGPSDMSTKEGEFYVTYPLLEAVRDALKQAAFKAGVGYWDMYEAMGGKNSMPSWVLADPQLAGSDYTHFTPRGARIISEFFYKALIIEYETYNNQKIKNETAVNKP
jgi:lysophospholipase L1-like esterase